jgi:hypothetical protein
MCLAYHFPKPYDAAVSASRNARFIFSKSSRTWPKVNSSRTGREEENNYAVMKVNETKYIYLWIA